MIDVFDFDHTIYDGDASLDFYFYSLCKHPKIIVYLPSQLWHAFLYLISINSRTKFKQGFFGFLRGLNNVDNDIKDFWKSHRENIKPWYLRRAHDHDVIISASPEFIIAPIAEEIGITKLIATNMDKRKGIISGKNCRGSEKVKRLNKEFENPVINEFYTDNLSDLPLLKLAKKKYIVKKQLVIPYEQYKPSFMKKTFLRKNFLTFIFVGGLNAFIGLSFAFLMSLLLENDTFAFAIGYCLGLVPSYFLNSTLTFHNYDYDIKAFIKYCVSYVPNFLIQTLCVGVFIELLSINTIVSYIVAVVIGVPVTFLIVSAFAIKNKEKE